LVVQNERFVRGGSVDDESMPGKYSEAIDFRIASERFSSIRKLRMFCCTGLTGIPELKNKFCES